MAFKVEPASSSNRQLEGEFKIMRVLKDGVGIPRALYFEKQKESNVMVMDLLGPSLEDLFSYCENRFSLKTVCMLAEEMILRIAALLRRSRVVSERKLVVGKTVLFYDALTVRTDGETTTPAGGMELPQKEFMLLFKLLSYPNQIFTRRQLKDEIWDTTSESDERTIDVHISRVRDRFRDNHDFEIVTVRGLGYKGVYLK